ncbi:hypothetical protein NP493_420g05028 [Ridgeia piscesae]|uniref:Uncharacterized protein n=1 Tax=Ridgeia piscesae TaxID=27915 RepID=A0AAD9L0V9_RIDPI|nr:hypothetical protein NP493_420g05028 [Ridgeia piscesae]
MSTPPPGGKSGATGGRHPAARALEEQVLIQNALSSGVAPPSDKERNNVDELYANSPQPAHKQSDSDPGAGLDSMMSSFASLATDASNMSNSHEQTASGMVMTNSWLDAVHGYSELEADSSAIFSSQHGTVLVECVNWATHDTGRPESPLVYDASMDGEEGKLSEAADIPGQGDITNMVEVRYIYMVEVRYIYMVEVRYIYMVE